ncbi:tRNA (adenosine(37)-N6)-dimethylallyltransferase MiaA [Flavobacterium sp.]|uniref:tRNA (adenosine(37)-N6)-dimethylallyltransferase MiaA n=1 Tax=Flavobacterium sp. TaxID=239 RepID=UPI0039E28688
MKTLLTIIGPTAIGKTALSIRLAQHFNCEIISCDSRQFYKEMSIGTAVPEPHELAAAPHHFIHNKSIFDSYSVGDFEKEAIAQLDKLFAVNDFAVLVGGSGLYVDAVLKGFDDFPEVAENIREKVSDEYAEEGISYLQEELKKRDPEYFATVDTGNPQRMMRALKVCLATGQPYSTFLKRKKNTRNFSPIVIGLEAERPIMYDRINQRVDLMMQAGLLEEAQKLHAYKNLNALQTVGYRELFAYFDGDFTLDFAVSEIKKNTRRFAKRQMTWFRRTENAQWFDFKYNLQDIIDYINKQIQK